MKKIVLALVFLFSMQLVIASEEVIFLDTTEINRLTVPNLQEMDYVQDNSIYHNQNDDADVSFSEEDMPENKVLRSFYKFVDDRAVNNKLNQFTSSMLEEIDDSY